METKISLLSEEPVQSPVLLMAYNRPDHIARVWSAVRESRPRRLWLAQDGPRPNDASDREKCSRVREIIEDVDWPCEVHRFYREENAGCGEAVSSAIDWFLDEADEGIILEDDVLPTRTFFRFCEVALEFYRNEADVATVAGFSPLPPRLQETLSRSGEGEPVLNVYLSQHFNMWGWATWRDRWEGYILHPDETRLAEFDRLIPAISRNPLQEISHRKVLESLQSVDTWDFQFEFHSWLHGRRHIAPTSSLTSNIGFDKEATHTRHESVFSDTNATPHDHVVLARPAVHEPDLDDICHYLRIEDSRIVETILEENEMLRTTCEERLNLIDSLHREANQMRTQKKKRSKTPRRTKPSAPPPSSYKDRLRRFFRS